MFSASSSFAEKSAGSFALMKHFSLLLSEHRVPTSNNPRNSLANLFYKDEIVHSLSLSGRPQGMVQLYAPLKIILQGLVSTQTCVCHACSPFKYLRKQGLLKHRKAEPKWQSWSERVRTVCASGLVSDEARWTRGWLAERTQEAGSCSNCKWQTRVCGLCWKATVVSSHKPEAHC